MKRLWLLLATWFLVGGTVAAQGTKPVEEFVDPTPTPWTLEKLDHPSAREIKFEKSETELPLRLWHPDPNLLEQKYVAIVRLSRPNPDPGKPSFAGGSSGGVGRDSVMELGSRGWNSSLAPLEPLGQLQLLGGRLLISGAKRRDDDSLQAGFERFVAQIPQERLPDEKLVAHFTSPDIDKGYLLNYSPGETKAPYTETTIQVLAPSPEVAEERAKTLLQLLDLGGSRAIQLGAFKIRETLAAQWLAERKEIGELDTKLDDLQEKIATYADFTSDMLIGLRLQQLQLDVNLSGAKARLTTCEALLKEGVPEVNRAKVEEVKLATAIEIAGIEASRLKSAELIKTVQAKNELQAQKDGLAVSREKLRVKLHALARNLGSLDVILTQNAPMPLVDNKILIHPIKWTP